MSNIIVPLNAFEQSDVQMLGQQAFIELIADAGADGVEIRRELLNFEKDPPLNELQQVIKKRKLIAVYSAPTYLWNEDQLLNTDLLTQVFKEAADLNAKFLKLSLGRFNPSKSDFQRLNEVVLKYSPIQLLIENDQTLHGGRKDLLVRFFESASRYNVPVRMTFDTGNWHYTGEDAEAAFIELAPYVSYLHLKSVAEKNGVLITEPISLEGKENWYFLRQLSSDIPIALEFPIQPKERTKVYVDFMKKSNKESWSLA
ncbi:sugar phosphate isomerase/epimerase family protein [Actinomycetes bacterium NPDC127524]